MKHYFSFKSEVIPGEQCFLMDNLGNWSEGYCKAVNVSVEGKDKVNLYYIGTFGPDPDLDDFYWLNFKKDSIANKEDFLEWQSRLIDSARDGFKYKGDMELMFGPSSYSNWIPFYLEEMIPGNAYMYGMGLISKEDE